MASVTAVAIPALLVLNLWTMVRFLLKADSYHGIWPHFLNGDTGRTIPFSRKDDGADLVETSFLVAGLLCARQFFDREDAAETRLRAAIIMPILLQPDRLDFAPCLSGVSADEHLREVAGAMERVCGGCLAGLGFYG